MNKVAITAVAIAVCGAVGANWYANTRADEVIAHQMQQFSEQTGFNVNYENVDYSLLSNTVVIKNVSFMNKETKLPLIDISSLSIAGYESDKISPYTELVINGLSFSSDWQKAPENTAALPDSIVKAQYDLVTSMSFDESNGDSEVKFSASAHNILDLVIDFNMTNSQGLMNLQREIDKMHEKGEMDLEAELQMQSKMMSAMQAVQPKAFSFSLNSDGELKTVVDELLQKNGLDHTQLQSMLSAQLDAVPASEVNKQAVKDFIAGLNSFEISMAFPEQTSMMQLAMQLQPLAADPQALEQFLNLKMAGN
ncbi:hypothetical protein [Pseudoalteromonas luteoviolacea]|uniref:DUF945 domain-containing protein n=1 Tax=Pseudoalteromonas luteoviolacea NCIMB 1942 TaxID=1365253 RepID=A0A167C6X6_9GAMM|nr:hypothetical protein [Pseudoalteromonas luteoviolacea]KZN47307.1 hypothetical protein N482_10345 [Pseudoalteromonas luteoviolacea NCIMB 1942]KZX01672.1 hypothetical protein JL49_04790 [Pseudoalteromonas luteoviolacea]